MTWRQWWLSLPVLLCRTRRSWAPLAALFIVIWMKDAPAAVYTWVLALVLGVLLAVKLIRLVGNVLATLVGLALGVVARRLRSSLGEAIVEVLTPLAVVVVIFAATIAATSSLLLVMFAFTRAPASVAQFGAAHRFNLDSDFLYVLPPVLAALVAAAAAVAWGGVMTWFYERVELSPRTWRTSCRTRRRRPLNTCNDVPRLPASTPGR